MVTYDNDTGIENEGDAERLLPELLSSAQWPPRQHTTTAEAAQMLGMSRSRVQHLCANYRARLEAEVRTGKKPKLAQQKHELRCRWHGMGRRTQYAPHLPSIQSYPIPTGPHRGHPIGWRPAKPYEHHLSPEEDVRFKQSRVNRQQGR